LAIGFEDFEAVSPEPEIRFVLNVRSCRKRRYSGLMYACSGSGRRAWSQFGLPSATRRPGARRHGYKPWRTTASCLAARKSGQV